MLNKQVLFVIGMLAFAVALAVVLGGRLAGQAAAIALGVAIGVIVGVPVGVATAFAVQHWGVFPAASQNHSAWPPGTLMLTPEQAEALLEQAQQPQRQQASPTLFARPAQRDRDFTVVGGADLSGEADE